MMFNSIPILSFVAVISLNAPFLASAFSPSPANSRWASSKVRLNNAKNAEEDSSDYVSSKQSRRDLFKNIPTTAAALTAVLGGAVSAPKAEAADRIILGPLTDLVGKWEGDQGFVMIAVPGPGSVPNGPGNFRILQFPYRETFEIKPLGDPALQRGGSIDQFSGVCLYTKTVWRTDQFPNNPEKQTVIHEENGMFFYLDPITKNPGPGGGEPDQNGDPVNPGERAPFAIARSAIIPHGNTAMIFGDVKTASGPPTIPDISTLPFTKPASGFSLGYLDQYINPPFVDLLPKKTLQDALDNGSPVSSTIHFSLDSENGTGGVLNTDFVTKRADTREFKADLWVQDLGNGKKQLQYAETANIHFHFNTRFLFFGPRGEIVWPHVMVNTLTKVA